MRMRCAMLPTLCAKVGGGGGSGVVFDAALLKVHVPSIRAVFNIQSSLSVELLFGDRQNSPQNKYQISNSSSSNYYYYCCCF